MDRPYRVPGLPTPKITTPNPFISPRSSHQYFVEAPALFRRGSVYVLPRFPHFKIVTFNLRYYLLFGHCCCFCLQGSGVIVYELLLIVLQVYCV